MGRINLLILLSPFIALAIFPLSGIIQRIKFAYKIKRMKPFDCEKCLGFWVCVLICIFTSTPYVLIIPFALSSMTVTYLISKKI